MSEIYNVSVESDGVTVQVIERPTQAAQVGLAAIDGLSASNVQAAISELVADVLEKMDAADAALFATAAQGDLADSAVQPGDLATVATTGAYSSLSGRPTLGTAAALDVNTGVQAYSAKLAAIAALIWASDTAPYFTGSGAIDKYGLSAFMRGLMGTSSASALKATLAITAAEIAFAAISGVDASTAQEALEVVGARPGKLVTEYASWQDAVDDAQTIYLPEGTISFTSQLLLNISHNTTFVGSPSGTVLDFNLTGHTDSCIKINTANYPYVEFRDVQINCNATGLDGFEFSAGVPRISGGIDAPYRDAIFFNCASDSYHWIENWRFDVLFTAVGRHVMHAYMLGGSHAGLPFINEGSFMGSELRGLGRRYADSNAIRVTFDGTDAACKMDVIDLAETNFDADQAGSLSASAVGDIVRAVSANSGHGTLSGLDWRKAGGWESTTGTVTGKYAVNADANVTVVRIWGGYVPYNWANNPTDAVLNLASTTWTNSTLGEFSPKMSTKPNGYTLEGDGAGIISGIKGTLAAYQSVQDLTALGTINFDIPINALTNYENQPPIDVVISHQAFAGSLGNAQVGRWWVFASRDGSTNYVNASLRESLVDGAPSGFDPTTGVAFSMVDNQTIRVAVTGGATVGTAGGRVNCFLSARRVSGMSFDTTPTLTTVRI